MTFKNRSSKRAARARDLEVDRRRRAQGWDGTSLGFGVTDPYQRAAQRREAFSKSSAGNIAAPAHGDVDDEAA